MAPPRATHGLDIVFDATPRTRDGSRRRSTTSTPRSSRQTRSRPVARSRQLSEGASVLVCSYDDLVELKEAAGRPQDILDLEALRAIREERVGDG
jgi:hypothetical protein